MNHQQLTEDNDESDDCDSGNDEPSDYFPLERKSLVKIQIVLFT